MRHNLILQLSFPAILLSCILLGLSACKKENQKEPVIYLTMAHTADLI